MPIRLSLDSAALASLLKDNPDIEVDLKSHAAEVVAQAFKRRVVTPQITHEVDVALSNALKTRYREKSVLNDKIKEAICETANEVISNTIRTHRETIFKEAMGSVVDRIEAQLPALLTKVEERLVERIDAMILERIGALFANMKAPG